MFEYGSVLLGIQVYNVFVMFNVDGFRSFLLAIHLYNLSLVFSFRPFMHILSQFCSILLGNQTKYVCVIISLIG
jgi:hypothetical protein